MGVSEAERQRLREVGKLGGRPRKADLIPEHFVPNVRVALEVLKRWIKARAEWESLPSGHLVAQRERAELALSSALIRSNLPDPEQDAPGYLVQLSALLETSGILEPP